MREAPDVHHSHDEQILVVEFHHIFGTDRSRDHEKQVARRKGPRDEYVVKGMLNNIDRLGLVKAELKCDQQPCKLMLARVFARRCDTTVLNDGANCSTLSKEELPESILKGCR